MPGYPRRPLVRGAGKSFDILASPVEEILRRALALSRITPLTVAHPNRARDIVPRSPPNRPGRGSRTGSGQLKIVSIASRSAPSSARFTAHLPFQDARFLKYDATTPLVKFVVLGLETFMGSVRSEMAWRCGCRRFNGSRTLVTQRFRPRKKS